MTQLKTVFPNDQLKSVYSHINGNLLQEQNASISAISDIVIDIDGVLNYFTASTDEVPAIVRQLGANDLNCLLPSVN